MKAKAKAKKKVKKKAKAKKKATAKATQMWVPYFVDEAATLIGHGYDEPEEKAKNFFARAKAKKSLMKCGNRVQARGVQAAQTAGQ